MKINFNGDILDSNDAIITHKNRGYKYGDGLFETMKTHNSAILFWEDHYFRLMSSMRIMRMEIPMNFTMEFLESEIVKVLKTNNLNIGNSRIRLTVDRGEGGYYKPIESTVNFLIEAEKISEPEAYYSQNKNDVILDIYKDHFLNPGLLSTLKSNNKIINILGSIYASENDLDNCFLLNTNKSVVEALAGNVFLVNNKNIKTPPLSDGCLRGIMRKNVIDILKLDEGYTIEETSISPFELQKADEIFITNVIKGITSVTRYRKKNYDKKTALYLIEKLNERVKKEIIKSRLT